MITSLLAPGCCCSDPVASCDAHGKIRITWQFQSGFNSSQKNTSEHQCCVYNQPGCTIPPPLVCHSVEVQSGDCAMATTTQCGASNTFYQGDCGQQFRQTLSTSRSMPNPVSLDFTYKTTTTTTGIAASWVYSGDNGTTSTQTVLACSFARYVDDYSDTVSTSWTITGSTGCCEVFGASQIGTVTGNDWRSEVINVKYHNRAWYWISPAPFTIRIQFNGGTARYYTIETAAGGVRTFKLWTLAQSLLYTLDITALSLEQVRAALDSQTTAPIVCASQMATISTAGTATRNLSSIVLEDRTFTPIPLYNQTAAQVVLFTAGRKTEWWQSESACPFWQVSTGGAVLRYDADPTKAFSGGFTPAAELLFCMGFETDTEIGTESPFPTWWTSTTYPDGYGGRDITGGQGYGYCAGLNNCFRCTHTSDGVNSVVPVGATMYQWGIRSVPLGNGTSYPINSDDVNDTVFITTVGQSSCDYSTGTTVCCPEYSEPCFPGEVTEQCDYYYSCSSWITQGLFRLERIV